MGFPFSSFTDASAMLATPERTANPSTYRAHRHRVKTVALVTRKICFRTNANVHQVRFGSFSKTSKTNVRNFELV